MTRFTDLIYEIVNVYCTEQIWGEYPSLSYATVYSKRFTQHRIEAPKRVECGEGVSPSPLGVESGEGVVPTPQKIFGFLISKW